MSFYEIARDASELESQCGITIDDVMHKLIQEVGELNDAIQKIRGRYCRSSITNDELRKEFGDVLFNLISLSRKMGINPDNLPELAEKTLESFRERVPMYQAMQKTIENNILKNKLKDYEIL